SFFGSRNTILLLFPKVLSYSTLFRSVTIRDVYGAFGAHSAGKISDADLYEMECVACPSAGSCGGQFTANTMATVAEAIGMALPMSGSPPAIDTDRDQFAVQCGKQVMKLLEMNLKPRDILTQK